MPPVLYTFRRCPYAMRARFALLYCNVSFEHREILLKNKPPCLLKASPKGTVPVLLLTTPLYAVVDESIDIMLWAFQHKGKTFQYTSKAIQIDDVDKSTDLITKNDMYFKYWLDRYKYADRYADCVMADSRAKAALFIDSLELVLQSAHYLSGKEVGFLDFAIMPFVRQFAGVDALWFGMQPWPKTQNWLAKISASNLFMRVMAKHKVWQPSGDLS